MRNLFFILVVGLGIASMANGAERDEELNGWLQWAQFPPEVTAKTPANQIMRPGPELVDIYVNGRRVDYLLSPSPYAFKREGFVSRVAAILDETALISWRVPRRFTGAARTMLDNWGVEFHGNTLLTISGRTLGFYGRHGENAKIRFDPEGDRVIRVTCVERNGREIVVRITDGTLPPPE